MQVAPIVNILVVLKHSVVMLGLTRLEEIGLEADYKSMVKFESLEDTNFQKVIQRLLPMIKPYGLKVEENWRQWELLSKSATYFLS
jgi:hypothetical protein